MTGARMIEIIISVVYFIGSIFSLILSWIKAKKMNNIAKQEQIKSSVKQAAEQFIKDAEQFTNYSGEEKLNYVLTRLTNINSGIYTEEELKELINSLVALTNNVNTVETKKGA